MRLSQHPVTNASKVQSKDQRGGRVDGVMVTTVSKIKQIRSETRDEFTNSSDHLAVTANISLS